MREVTLTAEEVEGFLRTIGEAQEAYQDEGRDEWFDVDDSLRDLAWDLQGILESRQA